MGEMNINKGPAIYKCVPGGRVDFGAMKNYRALFEVMKTFGAICGAMKFSVIYNGSLGNL